MESYTSEANTELALYMDAHTLLHRKKLLKSLLVVQKSTHTRTQKKTALAIFFVEYVLSGYEESGKRKNTY